MHAIKQQYNTTEKKLFLLCGGGVIVAVFLYAFFVNATVLNIVARGEAEQAAGDMVSVVGELEAHHTKLQNIISHEYARRHGFNDTAHKTFAARGGQPQKQVALSFSNMF